MRQRLSKHSIDYEIYSAYTSKKIIEKIRMKEGIDIQTPMQVLDQLSQKCYDEVIVQRYI